MLDLPHILWKIEETCKERIASKGNMEATPTLPSSCKQGEATGGEAS